MLDEACGTRRGPIILPAPRSLARYASTTSGSSAADCMFLVADFRVTLARSKPTLKPSRIPPEQVVCVLLVRVVSQCSLPLPHSQWGEYRSDLCPPPRRQLLSRQWSTRVELGQIPHVGVLSLHHRPNPTGRSWWVRARREYYR